MKVLHLVRLAPVIAASLLCTKGALAQTSPSSSPSSGDSSSASRAEPFRVRMPSTPVAGTKPGPWIAGPLISMVPSDPFALRGPSFQGLQTVPFSVQAAANPAMESRFVARRTVGGVLLGLSSPFLVTGGWLISTFSGIDGGPYGAGLLVGAGGVFLGATSFLIGVGLFIPGLIYVVTDPAPISAAKNRLRPNLHIGPNGAGLSMSF